MLEAMRDSTLEEGLRILFPAVKFALYLIAGLASIFVCTAIPASKLLTLHPAEATKYADA